MAEAVSTNIFLRLRELAQLFNPMDPSPLLERDLDAEAEEFILNWARELPSRDGLGLEIHVSSPPPRDGAAGVQNAVRNYFSTRAGMKRRELAHLLRRGRMSLAIGVLFLAVCLALGALAARLYPGVAATFLGEGLNIVGWVAMWRPLEIYLYDWWPIRDERRILESLSTMEVRVVFDGMLPAQHPQAA
ncbi:MAG: hypothetical protein ACREFX_12800 [Opitutaceae bacterium]